MSKDKVQDTCLAGVIHEAEAAPKPILMDCMQKAWLAFDALCIEMCREKENHV